MKALAQVTIPLPDSLNGFRFRGAAGEAFSNDTLLGGILSRLLLFAFIAAGLIFFYKLLSAGYAYMTSGGDPNKLASASKGLLNGAIGLFVVISCYFLAQIVQYLFGVTFL